MVLVRQMHLTLSLLLLKLTSGFQCHSRLFRPQQSIGPQRWISPRKDSTEEADHPTLLQKLNQAGLNLKSQAAESNAKATLAEVRRQRYRYLIQSCLLYTLFVFYRAFRGCFVLLPAVFQETVRKLETVVDNDPFNDGTKEATPTWRTKITVSLLATLITLSYALGGALRVFTKAIRASNVGIIESFREAAKEQERNEDSLDNRLRQKKR